MCDFRKEVLWWFVSYFSSVRVAPSKYSMITKDFRVSQKVWDLTKLNKSSASSLQWVLGLSSEPVLWSRRSADERTIVWAASYQLGSTCGMSRRVKPSWGLLSPHFGKRLNNCDNGLIKSTSVAEGLATFSPTSCFKLISQRRELRRFSSFCVTPDRPSVDEHFQLEVGILSKIIRVQH